MRMERELTEKEKKERVLYRFTRLATSVRRLWERCHLRVLIHDGIILFQGNFWAFLRGAALMRSSNLRSSSNPDFRFVPRRRRSAPENYFPQYRRLSRSSRACLSSFFLPPLPSPPRPSYFISENRDFEEKTIEETWKWKIFQNFLLKYILTRLKIDVVNSQLFLQFRFDNRRCIIRAFENRKNYLHLTIESWIT